jgi:hypothetical protein
MREPQVVSKPEMPSRGRPSDAQRRTAGRLLRWSLRNPTADLAVDPGALLRQVDEPTLVLLASYHKCEGWLYEALRVLPAVPPSLLASLKAARNWAAQRHLHAVWQLGRLMPVLEGVGIPWAVVKGPVLAEAIHMGAGRRTYDDLDLLVDPAGFRRVVDALEQHAGRVLDRNWALLRHERRGQVHFGLHGGLELDLHWNLINVHRRRMRIDTPVLLDRRQTVDVGGRPTPTLDPTDSLIHLAIHAAVSGGDRLVWLKDLERAVAVRPPAWHELVARSRDWRVAPAVGLMLGRARAVLHADVPAEVPVDLVGRARARLIAGIERRAALEASIGGPIPSRFLARTLGHGLAGGAAVLARRAARHFDPRGQTRYSAYSMRGTGADREAFFEDVESAGRRRPAR